MSHKQAKAIRKNLTNTKINRFPLANVTDRSYVDTKVREKRAQIGVTAEGLPDYFVYSTSTVVLASGCNRARYQQAKRFGNRVTI